MNDTERPGSRARWPLALIALPAAVAIWSGWVGLGELCGFGPVRLLPGITDWTLNTAITLPVGVEAYAAYALGAWMSPGTPERAARFAKWSALGALVYGMAGQIIYHLLAAAHAAAAPWPVVVVVSCMPVAVLGLAAALTHLLRLPQEEDEEPETVPVGVSARPRGGYKPPAQRKIMTSLGVGQGKARQFQRLLVSEVAAFDRGQGGAGTVPALAAPDVPARAAPEVPPSLAGTHKRSRGEDRPSPRVVPAAQPPAGARIPVPATPAGARNGQVTHG